MCGGGGAMMGGCVGLIDTLGLCRDSSFSGATLGEDA